MAKRAGLDGLYLVGVREGPVWSAESLGLDAATTSPHFLRRPWVSKRRPIEWLRRHYHEIAGKPTIYRYQDMISELSSNAIAEDLNFPCLVPNWDNTPRSAVNGVVFHGSTPELFKVHVERVLARIRRNPPERNLVFLKSWNEWAEGNHLEPDLKYGLGYLRVIRDAVSRDV